MFRLFEGGKFERYYVYNGLLMILITLNLVNSPFYYLQQNDVIYVEARRVKFDSTAIGSNITTILSILSFAFTSYIFFTRL